MADAGGLRRRVTGRRGLWIVATIAAVGAVLAVVGIWYLPDRMYPPGIDGGAEARAALQGGLLTAAAALIAVTGGLIASGADLARTKLGRAKLFEANLTGADLTRATFLRADLTGADLTDATLGGTSLFGMNLRETVGLVQGQVNAARGDARTLLPEGLVQPASWTPGGSGGILNGPTSDSASRPKRSPATEASGQNRASVDIAWIQKPRYAGDGLNTQVESMISPH